MVRRKHQAAEGSTRRQFRWLAPALGAVAVLVMGLGSEGAYAYFTGLGSGTGQATVGSAVTVTVTASSGAADLLPGGTGAAWFTLTNTNPRGATFSKVTAASVSSTSNGSCPASNITLPTFPYTVSPAVTVNANATSGSQSIAGLVTLSASAPNACQGVIFTVTLTLSGQMT